jgi:uncharacterized protein
MKRVGSWMYENGQGVPKDYQQGIAWYRKATDEGHAIAQNNLGGMYENGRGVPKDDKEAIKWYRLAAEQGYAKKQAMRVIPYPRT